MQWFFLCLTVIWTTIFGFMFFMLFPDIPERITAPRYHFNSPSQQPCPREQRLPKADINEEEGVPIPLEKGAPSVHLQMRGADEIPKTEEQLRRELEQQMQTSFEQRLVGILVKINVAACTECNRDDKRVILQLKMMKALLDGRPKDALKLSEELNKYLNSTSPKIKIVPPKPKSKKPTD